MSYVYACGDFFKTLKFCIFRGLNFPEIKNPHMCTSEGIFSKPYNLYFQGSEFSSRQKSSYVYARRNFFKTLKFCILRGLNFLAAKIFVCVRV